MNLTNVPAGFPHGGQSNSLLSWLCPAYLRQELNDCLVTGPAGTLLFLDRAGANRYRSGTAQSFFEYIFGKRQQNPYTMELQGIEPLARVSFVLPYIWNTCSAFGVDVSRHVMIPTGYGGEAWRSACYLLQEFGKYGVTADDVRLKVEPDARHTGQNALFAARESLPFLQEFPHPHHHAIFTSPYHAFALWLVIKALQQIHQTIAEASSGAKNAWGEYADARIFTAGDAHWQEDDSLAFVLVPYAPDAVADPGEVFSSRVMYIANLARPADTLIRAILDDRPLQESKQAFTHVIEITKHACDLLHTIEVGQKPIASWQRGTTWSDAEKRSFLARCRDAYRVEVLINRSCFLADIGFQAVLNGLNDLRTFQDLSTQHVRENADRVLQQLRFARENLQWIADPDLRPDVRIVEQDQAHTFLTNSSVPPPRIR